MKSFSEYVKHKMLMENSLQNKPIIFAGNKGVIIPSEHGGNIKLPENQQQLQMIKSIAENYGFYFEGVGEGKAGGQLESTWLKDNLGVNNPKNNGSYDKLITAYQGLPGAATIFSSLHANLSNFQQLLNDPNLKTCADVLLYVLTHGISMEQPISQQDAQKFLQICEADNLNLTQTPASQFLNKALEAENLMWGGNNPDGSRNDTNLGRFAHNVEKERRKQIHNLANTKGGIFFLGSDHLPAMAQEIGN
jgi:hypothetical protein